MKQSTELVVALVAAFALVFGGFFVLTEYSGVNPPFTVVESSSMQHDDVSAIGVIDTGDLILLKDLSNTTVVTYIEGYASGYSTFGEYGNVIIYERGDNAHPVIHRAILWLDYNTNGTWSASTLSSYVDQNGNNLWSCSDSTDCLQLSGTLTIYDIGYGSKTSSINLDTLSASYPHSGYLTMGDNAVTNCSFDQTSGISPNGLVTKDIIRAVAWYEFPWLGALKLWMNGETTYLDLWAPNSLPNLALMVVMILALLVAINYTVEEAYMIHVRKKRRQLQL